MAMPDEYPDRGPAAPGAPGEPLDEFVDTFFLRSDQRQRQDAYELSLAYHRWRQENDLPPADPRRLYADLRLDLGLEVRRSSQNRMWVTGLVVHPHLQAEYSRLVAEARLHAREPGPTLQTEVATMSRDLRTQARFLAQDALERILPASFAVVAGSLESPDESTRLRAAELIWSRLIPKVAVRQVDPDPVVETLVMENRPTVGEIVAIMKKQGFDQRSKSSTGVEGTTEG